MAVCHLPSLPNAILVPTVLALNLLETVYISSSAGGEWGRDGPGSNAWISYPIAFSPATTASNLLPDQIVILPPIQTFCFWGGFRLLLPSKVNQSQPEHKNLRYMLPPKVSKGQQATSGGDSRSWTLQRHVSGLSSASLTRWWMSCSCIRTWVSAELSGLCSMQDSLSSQKAMAFTSWRAIMILVTVFRKPKTGRFRLASAVDPQSDARIWIQIYTK